MRPTSLAVALCALLVSGLPACGGDGETTDSLGAPQCSDGKDNDGDGAIDFPDDDGCVSANDESEDSLASAKCMDGRDNDGDGKTDYPNDPGCFAPQADDETDDCPDGPQCPACGDGIDNDENGAIDYPNDPGCTAAADDDEFIHNPVACGATMMVKPLPPTGLAMGELGGTSTSSSAIASPCGGGGGSYAVAFELHLATNRVVEVSTDDQLTTADTVIDIRSEDCSALESEIACNDDLAPTNHKSKVTAALRAGDYYIIVSGHDSSASGTFAVQVKTFAGEQSSCVMDTDCGPGLVCRTAVGATALTCLKPQCADDVDDDGDGKVGYPTDPGCTSLDDNSEADTCPGVGPGCPECSDGADNDGDGKTDYPMDPTCAAAGDSSEACVSTDGVPLVTMSGQASTTVGAVNDVRPTCSSSSSMAPDKTFRLDLPATTTLRIEPVTTWDSVAALYDATCGGTAIACQDNDVIIRTNQPAGTYFLVVDGYSTSSTGAFTVSVAGKIANGASCESPLATSGALTCGQSFTCKGTAGARTCQPGLCGDGIDNDGDGKTDYPNDPGCTDLGDDTEEDPATPPVCANSSDDDADGAIDFPADYGCSSAAGTSEVFCTGEVDPTSLITTNPTTGTTVGLANNFTSAMNCPTSSPSTNGPDKVFALAVPVYLNSLTMDLATSSFDTTLTFRDASCATQLACNDDSAGRQSKLMVPNVTPGNYAIVVDGYGSGTTGAAGTYKLVVKGVAAAGQACTSTLFAGGVDAVLSCPTACTAGLCN